MRIVVMAMILHFAVLRAQADLPGIRSRFTAAASNERLLRSLAKDLEPAKSPEAKGYRAVALMMMANTVFNPASKYRYFISGRDLLEDVIEKHPENCELRLLRLSVQREIPSFLGYSRCIDDDIAFIRTNFAGLRDIALKHLIAGYFSGNKIALKPAVP